MTALPHVQTDNGVRVLYVQEGDTWWAYADLRFSAAADGLVTLKLQVR